jgi:hypothetical protein
MKKIVYLLSALMLAFTACDPMEDAYNELDAIADGKQDKGIVVNKTFVAADYQFFKTPAPTVASRLAFSSEDQAVELLPSFINDKFKHLKEGAVVNITFNQALYPTLSNTVATNARVTISSSEYTAIGRTDRITSSADLITYLNFKYPTPVERQLVAITYKVSDPADNTKTVTMKDSFFFMDGSWMKVYHVTDAEYASTGNGKFNNFDSNSDAHLLNYINQFLTNYYVKNGLVAKVGDVQYVSYAYFGGGTNQRLAVMVYNGTKWIEAVTQFTANTLKFKKTKGAWVVDLTITYILPRADYNWIGIDNPSPNYGTAVNRANVAQFGSYFTQFSTDTRYWTQEEINKSLIALIKHKFPNPKEGIKFEMVYKVYSGSTETKSTIFAKNEAGQYVEFKP